MGDNRYLHALDDLRAASDPSAHLSRMGEAAVIQALGAASATGDAYLGNVLATELLNRVGYTLARGMSLSLLVAGAFSILCALIAGLAPQVAWPTWVLFSLMGVGLLFGGAILWVARVAVHRARVGYFERALRAH